MRNLTFVCAGLALVGGLVAANLWRELRAERELTADLRSQVSELQIGLSLRPTAVADLPQPAVAVISKVEPSSHATQPSAKESDGPAQGATGALPAFVLNQQELMKDPEYRKARLAQTRATIAQSYPGLVEELGLTPEDAVRLFDLLAESQLKMNETSLVAAVLNGGQPDPGVLENANRRRQELQREQDQALMNMLGGGRYTQWREYQQTRGFRQQVVQLGRALESAGVPMTPEQARPLTAAYIAEQRRQREDVRRLQTSAGPVSPADPVRRREEQSKLQEESNRRLVEAAKPYLTAQQLEALQTSLNRSSR
jgi:hypothetical protein